MSVILVDPIGCVERNSRKELCRRINEEEIVSDVIKAVAQRMTDAVEKVIDDGVAINPVVIITSAK